MRPLPLAFLGLRNLQTISSVRARDGVRERLALELGLEELTKARTGILQGVVLQIRLDAAMFRYFKGLLRNLL